MGYADIPILSKEQIETEVLTILESYNPSKIESPGPFDIENFIEQHLQLNFDYKLLSKRSDEILGLIAFTSGGLTVFDPDTLNRKVIHVNERTIVIDERLATDKYQNPRYRFTCAHEAAHWHLHRFYYMDENQTELFSAQEASAIKCLSRNIERKFAQSFSDKTPADWLEWQSDYMASALLMPEKAYKKAFRKMSPSSLVYNNTDSLCLKIINNLADIFQVSRQAARIRLFHLGLFRYEHLGQTSLY